MNLKLLIPYLIVGFIVLVAFLLPWKYINWGTMTTAYERNIVVQGYAESEKGNQLASFSATVTAIDADKNKAVKDMNGKIDILVAKIKEFGIPDSDIKTQSMNLYQEYNQATGSQEGGKYNATNTVEVKLRDVSKTGELSTVLAENSNNFYGPNFTVDTVSSMGDDLLGAAVENAKKKAEATVKSTGRKLGRIISIQEGYSGSAMYPMYRDMGMGMGGGAGGGSMPGTSTISKTVTVMFELQ